MQGFCTQSGDRLTRTTRRAIKSSSHISKPILGTNLLAKEDIVPRIADGVIDFNCLGLRVPVKGR